MPAFDPRRPVRWLLHRIVELLAPHRCSPVQELLVIVSVDEQMGGLQFDWGPEVEELGQRLADTRSGENARAFVEHARRFIAPCAGAAGAGGQP